MGEGIVVFDRAGTKVHVLNPAAARVFTACAQHLSRADLVDLLHHASGESSDRLATDVDAALDQLRRQGLLTGEPQREAPHPPDLVRSAMPAGSASATPGAPRFSVLGQVVAVHGTDPRLLADIGHLLADLATDEPATTVLTVADAGSGHLHTSGDHWRPRTWPSAAALLDQLPTLLNLLTPHVQGALALHAGAVARGDDGVVVIAGDSGAGKSTLIGAMVQRGWRYASDEAVAVRPGTLTAVAYPKPLALAPGARRALGLPPGATHTAVRELAGSAVVVRAHLPVRAVVLPRRRPGTTVVELVPPGAPAAVAIAPHALNLRAARLPALEALAALATRVPVLRMDHGGVESDVVDAITTAYERFHPGQP